MVPVEISTRTEIEQCLQEEKPFIYRGGVYKLSIVPDQCPEWKSVDAFSRKFTNPVMIRCYFKANDPNSIVRETDCEYKRGTVADMLNPTSSLFDPIVPSWMYCDYKDSLNFMSEKEAEETFQWHRIAPNRISQDMSRETTVWIGTKGANTPLHYDTYSSNFIAQLSGRKRWRIFPPSASKDLNPTRIPFEESSVYSNATGRGDEIVLEPGDLLYLPKHWWHFVECLDPISLSINLWLPHPTDPMDRVQEATARFLFNILAPNEWLNPTERVLTTSESFDLLKNAVGRNLKQKEFVDAVLDSQILQRIAEKLTIG